MRWMPEHAPRHGDAVGDPEKQHVVPVSLRPAVEAGQRHMGVHLGKARNNELARGVDDGRSRRWRVVDERSVAHHEIELPIFGTVLHRQHLAVPDDGIRGEGRGGYGHESRDH